MSKAANRQANPNGTSHVLVILGSPNDSEGRLSPIAAGRANAAVKAYKAIKGCKIVLTGGFGERFNTTDRPHTYYLKRHLLANGVESSDIIAEAESSNTVQDAVLAKKTLERHHFDTLSVITSSYHVERAKVIFSHVFPSDHLEFIGAPAGVSQHELEKLQNHEADALRRIHNQGGVILPE